MNNKHNDKESSVQSLDPILEKNHALFPEDQQLTPDGVLPTKKRSRRVTIVVLVAAVSLAVIIVVATLVISSLVLNTTEGQSSHSPGDKDYPVQLSASEEQAVSQEVVSTLRQKYGSAASFKVLNMKKGKLFIADLGSHAYFNIKMHIKSSEIESDFNVDYERRTDDLWSVLQAKYQYDIIDALKAVNSSIDSASFSLSDYGGLSGDSDKDFSSLNTKIGHVPSRRDVEALIQSIDITCGSADGVDEYKNGIEEFITAKKSEIKKLYAYIAVTYPRIPKGIGVTSVVIDFGNGVIVRISPLSKDIVVTEQGNGAETVDYEWSELVD
jgi:hypothetical protein